MAQMPRVNKTKPFCIYITRVLTLGEVCCGVQYCERDLDAVFEVGLNKKQGYALTSSIGQFHIRSNLSKNHIDLQ